MNVPATRALIKDFTLRPETRSSVSRSNPIPGFTLPELLVVIVIAGILVALIFPAVSSMSRNSLAAKCLSNLRQSGVAMFNFAAENNMEIILIDNGSPRVQTDYNWSGNLVNRGYLDDGEAARCPAWPPDSFIKSQTYGATLDIRLDPYTSTKGSSATVRVLRLNVIEKPASYILLGDSLQGNSSGSAENNPQHHVIRRQSGSTSGYFHLRHGGKGNVLMAEGSCRAVDAAEYAQLRRDMYALTGAPNADTSPVFAFDEKGDGMDIP